MNNKIKKIFVVSVLSMILLITPVASQPQWPMILYGDILVNDQPAPVGTIIAAYDGTTCIGTVTIESEGQYGENPTNRLVVNEPTGDIQIYIQSPSMSSSVEAKEVLDFWNTGDVVRFDLSADVTESSSGTDLKNSGSGSSSSSSGLSFSTEDNNVDVAMPGGSGEDTGLSQEATQTPQDTASSSGSDDLSSTWNSNLTLLIALLIGVIALIALFYGRSKNMF